MFKSKHSLEKKNIGCVKKNSEGLHVRIFHIPGFTNIHDVCNEVEIV